SQVHADDSRLTRIYSHFQANLESICRVATNSGIPVILCSIPVNLRDSSPFGSMHRPNLSADRIEAWDALFKEGKRLEADKHFAEAIRRYRDAEQIDDSYAELAYRLGRCLAASGEAEESHRQYVHARDLDVLRFRSDSAINKTIREVAAA